MIRLIVPYCGIDLLLIVSRVEKENEPLGYTDEVHQLSSHQPQKLMLDVSRRKCHELTFVAKDYITLKEACGHFSNACFGKSGSASVFYILCTRVLIEASKFHNQDMRNDYDVTALCPFFYTLKVLDDADLQRPVPVKHRKEVDEWRSYCE